MLRFVRNLKIKTKMSKEETVCEGDLTVEELSNAETQWLRSVQKNMRSQANYSQLEREFGVYEDDSGVLGCKGRIANADLPLETTFQHYYQETTIFQPYWLCKPMRECTTTRWKLP